MSKKTKTTSVKFEIDLDTLEIVGKIEAGESNPTTSDVNLKLLESIKRSLDNMASWTKELKSLVALNKNVEAFQVLEANKGKLELLKEPILEDLIKIDKTSLEKAQRKELGLLIVFIAYRENSFEKVEDEIDEFLNEFSNEVEPGLLQSLLLSKANAAAKNNKLNVANYYYKKVIQSKDTDPTDLAFAFRGLAMNTPSNDESIKYRNQSIDKFLEAGKKKEAIKDLVYLSSHHYRQDPNTALELIDKAINLYGSETNLNKEISAGLFHKKSGYLYSLGNIREALESAEIACDLRENLIGNEYERYSSYSIALSLSKLQKDELRIAKYSEKLTALAPSISDPEFKLQVQLQQCMESKAKVEGSLLKEIEALDSKQLMYSAYICNGTHNAFSFEEKLEWLDKAKLLLDEKEFSNQHFAVLFFSIAEEHRKNRKIDEALNNYQVSLEYNPFYKDALQNCGAVLWEESRWNESVSFFKKQFDIFGDSPTLNYAYGRSLYETGQFNEAINHFKKCIDRIEGVDINKYILLCVEKSGNIKLDIDKNSNEYEAPISLNSFKAALEDFAVTISSNSRMHFWQRSDDNTYKWVSSPEERAKQHLITALEMKFGKKSIDIIQESKAGAGIIDLYIFLRGGTKIVVELKICGANYSSTYALSGENQLIHYIKNTQTRVGFLVVFDGRLRDFGQGFKPLNSIGDITIHTIAIEMTPKIDP